MSRRYALSWVILLGLAVFLPQGAYAQTDPITGPTVIEPVFVGETVSLWELADTPAPALKQLKAGAGRQVPNPDLDLRSLKSPALRARTQALLAAPAGDPVRQTTDGLAGTTPEPTLSFEGTSDDDNADVLGFRVVPPDTEGDIGEKYYVQMNNSVFEIFDKTDGSSVLGPLPNNIFFAGTGTACELTNDGDPIVLYDHAEKRWILSQFALPVFGAGVPDVDGHQCFAVSQTKDPLGAYYIYDYVTALPEFGGVFAINDYPKLGVWTDGYYYTANDFECLLTSPTTCSFTFTNVSAIAFDKKDMLKGKPATAIQFKIGPIGATDEIFIGVQPSHWEGKKKPKKGTPNTFWQGFDSEEFTFSGSTGPDGMWHWDFSADFKKPMKSTFVSQGLVEFPEYESFVCAGVGRNCIDQPSPGTVADNQGLDSIDFRTMFRSQYRQFGKYASVVVSMAADADGDPDNGSVAAGVRWAELRKDDKGKKGKRGKKGKEGGWSLHQAGTFAPDDGEQRFMPSIAQNKQGVIALGYTVSSTQTYPSVRYTTRQEDDPLGMMSGGEVSCFDGTGSQIDSFNRWGDYSAMSVDPKDECTFWYTNEYYEDDARFDFKTRICKFGACGKGRK